MIEVAKSGKMRGLTRSPFMHASPPHSSPYGRGTTSQSLIG